MEITPFIRGKKTWNRFLERYYPPVGAFMQTWEWGEFQKMLGRKVERYSITREGKDAGIFMLVRHVLPLGFSYGYLPRGPVMRDPQEYEEAFHSIKAWASRGYMAEPFPARETVCVKELPLGAKIEISMIAVKN